MAERGRLIVYSGPSGVGKGTLLERLIGRRENTVLSVSATTRAPRPGEEDGVHYHFVTRQRFEQLISIGGMLEFAEYGGQLYGTPKMYVEEQLRLGRDVVLEIEVKGAMQVKKAMPEAVLVFVMPPSFAELERRLRGRGTEDEGQIRKRLATAREEMRRAYEYEYVLVNDQVETAAQKLWAILDACGCRLPYMKQWIDEVNKDAQTVDE